MSSDVGRGAAESALHPSDAMSSKPVRALGASLLPRRYSAADKLIRPERVREFAGLLGDRCRAVEFTGPAHVQLLREEPERRGAVRRSLDERRAAPPLRYSAEVASTVRGVSDEGNE
jgi:hypothetical protein